MNSSRRQPLVVVVVVAATTITAVVLVVVHKDPEGEECNGSIVHEMPVGSDNAFDGGNVWYCVVTIVIVTVTVCR